MKSIRDQIWEKALLLISHRQMSSHDLRAKLRLKFPNESDQIDLTIDEMKRVHLINDARYADLLVHHLMQRNIGRLKMKLEAKKRGIDWDDVDSLLLSAGYDEREWCKRALQAKLNSVREADPRKRKQKLMNFLRNRGFTDTVIFQELRKQDSLQDG